MLIADSCVAIAEFVEEPQQTRIGTAVVHDEPGVHAVHPAVVR
jgi:hypothetical protein